MYPISSLFVQSRLVPGAVRPMLTAHAFIRGWGPPVLLCLPFIPSFSVSLLPFFPPTFCLATGRCVCSPTDCILAWVYTSSLYTNRNIALCICIAQIHHVQKCDAHIFSVEECNSFAGSFHYVFYSDKVCTAERCLLHIIMYIALPNMIYTC